MWDYMDIDHFYIVLGLSIFAFLFVAEYLGPNVVAKNNHGSCYGYGRRDGPHVWADSFDEAAGCNQSPINLISCEAMVVHVETLDQPLEFSLEYLEIPKELMLLNDGHTVNLIPSWSTKCVPMISGGPLDDVYEFHALRFRWGNHDEEGTEHMIDHKRYAMEVQTSWMRGGSRNLYKAAADGDVIIVAYIYQITPVDNPYLDVVLSHLGPSGVPFYNVPIEQIPLSLLAPPFACGFFSYQGSLTFPPCTEGVRWIVQPEPLSISQKQIRRFRKTPTPYCGAGVNVRPVQELNNREVIFYE